MYKLYQTTKDIPWLTINNNVVPDIQLPDTWFNFELVANTGINFKTWNTGSIVVASRDIKYFKLEKEGQRDSYWFVVRVSRVLKTGYELELQMDYWMTFIRHTFSKMLLADAKPYINRIYFNNDMLKQDENLRNLIYYSFALDDELFDNAQFSYKVIKPYASIAKIPGESLTGGDCYWPIFTPAGYCNGQSGTNIMGIGYYLVMLPVDKNKFDFYPIINKVLPQSQTVNVDNRIDTLFNNIVKLKFNGATSLYNSNSFKGIYRGPVLLKKNYQGYVSFEATTTGNTTNIYTSISSFEPLTVCFPRQYIPFDGDLKNNYITCLEPHIWGNNEILLKKYFYASKREIIDESKQSWNLNFDVTFMDGFLLTPSIVSPYTTTQELVTFGDVLPSMDNQYFEQIRTIKTTYNTGLASATINAIQGAPAAVGKGVVNPAWGITSALNSFITLGRDIANLEINKNLKMRAANIGYNTTNNENYFASQYWWNNTYNSPITYITIENIAGQDKIPFKFGLLVKEFTDEQKEQIKFIISNYGYKLNMCIPIKKWWEFVHGREIAPIKFDATWLINNLPRIDNTLTIDEQGELINQLSNGIIIDRSFT